jgi:DNA-binding transcriptional MerR regulator
MAIEKSYIDMLKERDTKIEALKELLRLSHESLDSKDIEIAELENKCELSARCNKELDKTNNQLEGRIAELEKGYEELRMAALDAVCKISGGQTKADLRDAYDKATDYLESLKEQQ